MLDRHSCVLRIGYQLSSGPCVTTKLFEDRQMVGTRTNDASVRTIREFSYEGEHLVHGRWPGEDAAIGHDADEARKH